MNKQPVLYYQTDPKWKSIPYAVAGESATIGGSGCGPTSMAMVLATWADKTVTPKTECAWALSHGYKAKGQGTYYSYFVPAAKRYGLECRQLNAASIYGNSSSAHHAAVKQELDRGNFVIACMGKGLWTRSGHYVLVWAVDGNTVFINDPASSSQARVRGSWSLFRQQVKFYWVIKRPASMRKEEPDLTLKETQVLIDSALIKQKAEIVAEVARMLEGMKEKIYDTVEEVPAWARPSVKGRVEAGILQGDEHGRLRLTEIMMRMMVMEDRAKEMGMD